MFYATDFADQLENIILPALKAGFIVLADRYIYTLMARDMVRGMDEAWLKNLYGIALEPDAVFYLSVEPQELVQRNLAKSATLDYWESGMDLGLSRDMFDSFLKYQTAMQGAFRKLQKTYDFTIVDGNRPVGSITKELRKKIRALLVDRSRLRLVGSIRRRRNLVGGRRANPAGSGGAAQIVWLTRQTAFAVPASVPPGCVAGPVPSPGAFAGQCSSRFHDSVPGLPR